MIPELNTDDERWLRELLTDHTTDVAPAASLLSEDLAAVHERGVRILAALDVDEVTVWTDHT